MRRSLFLSAVFLFSCGAQTPGPKASSSVGNGSPQSGDQVTKNLVVQLAANEVAQQRAARERAELQRDIEVVRRELMELREEIKGTATAPPPPIRPKRPRPDPAAVYALNIQDSPSRGPDNALVTVVKNFEFACPYCEKSRSSMDQLLKDYKGDLRIVYKHFIVHPQTATAPALASCAAGKQGKWHRMATLIWEQAYPGRDFSREHLEKLARKAKLNMRRFRKDRDGECAILISQDQKESSAVGTRGTPAFYINGRFLSGARPLDQFKKLVDEELAKAQAVIQQNGSVTRANYYDLEIMGKGKTKLDPVP